MIMIIFVCFFHYWKIVVSCIHSDTETTTVCKFHTCSQEVVEIENVKNLEMQTL